MISRLSSLTAGVVRVPRATPILLFLIAQTVGADGCVIQISSVSVSPRAIHGSAEPSEAVVIVQLAASGAVPAGARATVGVATYSSDPPGNLVSYDNDLTLPVTTSPTIFRFKVHGGRGTASGHLTIIAEVRAASAGLTVKEPQPTESRVQLDTLTP